MEKPSSPLSAVVSRLRENYLLINDPPYPDERRMECGTKHAP